MLEDYFIFSYTSFFLLFRSIQNAIHFIGNILFTSEFAIIVVIDGSGMSGNSLLAARMSRKDRFTYCDMAERFFFSSEPRVPILVIDETN